MEDIGESHQKKNGGEGTIKRGVTKLYGSFAAGCPELHGEE